MNSFMCDFSLICVQYLTDSSLATSCGGEIEVGSNLKYITSPGWPEPYNKTTECVWHVRATSPKKIQFILLGFITKKEYYNILVRYISIILYVV